MRPSRAFSGLWFTPLLAGALILGTRDAVAENSCVTAPCHATLLTPATVHPPTESCDTCHDPHGGDNAKLLVAKFPTGPYVPYNETEYALCFSCHKRDLVQYPDTSFATGFRDGERNLHYLLVNNKQKGAPLVDDPSAGFVPAVLIVLSRLWVFSATPFL